MHRKNTITRHKAINLAYRYYRKYLTVFLFYFRFIDPRILLNAIRFVFPFSQHCSLFRFVQWSFKLDTSTGYAGVFLWTRYSNIASTLYILTYCLAALSRCCAVTLDTGVLYLSCTQRRSTHLRRLARTRPVRARQRRLSRRCCVPCTTLARSRSPPSWWMAKRMER